ncbi:S8 family serine peptidase [Streptomyces antibioticus]|uniref:S8 family serine peptidase n=1 Tax=Streptomyces antibioticus TaxID=1890 RepID=UPI003D7541CB
MLGALVVLSAGLAPSAAADVQSDQWYLSAMQAEEMWKVSTGKGVKVAVIDSGVNPNTPSLKGQVLAEAPMAVSYKATEDYLSHGTSMAELIAGTGAGGGLKGLAPGAKIVPYRIATTKLKNKTEVKKAPSIADVIRAIADSDAKIISMSITSSVNDEDELAAVKYAHSKGKLMIAGTGNDAQTKNFIGYPAAYPYVVGVAASDKNGTVAEFSEYGNYVDLASPGLHVPTWCDNEFNSYCDSEGTSQATAIASASAALVWSAHPDWTANQVLASLIDTAGRDWARDDPSTYLGYGLIRPRKVLEDSGYKPVAADTDPLATENTEGVEEDPSAASPSASTSSQAPKDTSGGATSATGSSSESSDDTTMWVTLGAAAAVLVVGGGAFAVIRSRRRT